MSSRLCRNAVHLLVVLWAAAMSDAHQPQPVPAASSEDVLDQLLMLISGAVKTAIDPIIAELNSQRELLDNQRELLDDIASKLRNQDSRIDSLNSRLDSVSSQHDSLLGSLNSGLDSVNTRLDGLSVQPESRQECNRTEPGEPPRACSDLPAGIRSGVHLLQLGLGRSDPVEAFCDMTTDGGGWTVFQRRADILPRQDFYRNWTDYRSGFGELTAEFWWGLEKLWLMTSPLSSRYELRVDLEDFDGERRHAVYQDFRISSESDGYRLTGGSYTGNAGDSLAYHFGQLFTTKDKDQDKDPGNCAAHWKGAWWYQKCFQTNLNGQYLSGKTTGDVRGISWKAWKGNHYSLKSVEMKIRPTIKSV